MTEPATAAARTPLDLLVANLRGRDAASDGQARPCAILWPDGNREWERLLPILRNRMPELLTLGGYDPDARTGPAIWLRCVVDGTIEPSGMPAADGPPEPSDQRPTARLPILYLPGFERGDLRAGEACPEAVRPLVELLYRGVLWNHPNGRDWTVAAFLGSPRGVGLDIAGDRATLAADRGHRGPRRRCPDPEPAGPAGVPGEREGCRAESIHQRP